MTPSQIQLITPLEVSTLNNFPNWFTRPASLWKDKTYWPVHSSNEAKEAFTLSDDDPEVKKGVTLVTNTDESFASWASRLEYFSDYHRAKKAVALCLLYIKTLKERVKSRKPVCFEKPLPKTIQRRSISQVANAPEVTSQSQFLAVATMQQAEIFVIRAVQATHFDEEIKVLISANKNHAIKKSSPLFKVDPFLDSAGRYFNQ